MTDEIVDYVEIIPDRNGQFRVRGRSNNGEIIWTSEQYKDREWAEKIAGDTGKEVRVVKDMDDPTETPPIQSPDGTE